MRLFGHPSLPLLLGALGFVALSASVGSAEDVAKSTGDKPTTITPEQTKFFETSIRPLLVEKCFSCHSDQAQRGGLRLDSRAFLLKGNAHGPAIVPGAPDQSNLIRAISYTGKIMMPPPGKLRPAEIAALTAWVKMGAPWPEAQAQGGAANGQAPDLTLTDAQKSFWSFRPVKKPTLPKVKNVAWAQTPIDRFVLAQLEANGLKPAPCADRRTLIRRVTYDLIGLPPTPQEVEAFVNDKSPDAWAKVIDRLLASPQYGERWGRHWLDLVRYADSNGLDENVAFANAYRYRDYVVNAFNKDKPYDQFVTEQLAGDLMPGASDEAVRNERLTATGFLELGPKVLAEPDKEKMVMDIVDEQIEVSSKAFLGLTVACARCHNHKFDPIPTKDYYALAGIFKSTKTMESLNTVAMWEEKPISTPAIRAEQAAYQQKLQEAQKAVQTIREQGDADLLAAFRKVAGKYVLAGWEASRGMLRSVAESNEKFPYKNVIEAENYDRGGGIAKEFNGFGKGIGVIHTVGLPSFAEWDITVPTAGKYQVELRYASGEVRPVNLLLNGKLIREKTAAANTGSFFPDTQRWEPQGVFTFQAGKNTLRMERNGDIPHFDKVLVVTAPVTADGVTPKSPEQVASERGLNVGFVQQAAQIEGSLKTDPSHMTPESLAAETARLVQKIKAPEHSEKYYPNTLHEALTKAENQLKTTQENAPRPAMVMAADEDKIADCRVHIRGDTLNLGDSVPRHFLTVLGGDKDPGIDAKHSGRLELAQWIVRPTNPLTARVEVNRIWQEHFGTGLVGTPDNFGLLGDRPSNPALLDWLAATFVEKGWSLKQMHRIILLSNTYKMACTTDPVTQAKADKVDPGNQLLWKMPRRRMDADAFRDSILAISGKLDLTMGGSLLTTKNHDYVTNDQSGNAAQYDSPRRSLYLPIIRNALFDMFQAFDMGDPSMVNARRSTTTVAPQALYVMNSPFVLAQSKAFAASLLTDATATDADRIKLAYLKVYSRPPTAVETARAQKFLTSYAGLLAKSEPDANKCREKSWASWCQILYASNAFIYLD